MSVGARGSVHHIDLNVRDLAASKRVYGPILDFLGYRQVKDDPQGCEWDLGSGNARTSLGLRPCDPSLMGYAHQRYAPGLHHIAWCAESREAVDAVYRRLVDLGITVLDAPAPYPEYSADYYAVFFEDPDGMKLEVLHE